ncbi:RNA polymerase sigma factor [Pseudacidobacterium ailaaui]|jgi:RNA polymerase sigma-70 factor (ECF subfamily)|uniref:RNA polymerase sigma factor n=1 Tax=Pseudacidobacterium ailaaui TaxID=1382359 RepID=UPI00047BC815|nr:RNA polymerase sigma factor [Pseudacidobacterium ailaaui]MBX6360194.1 RNA polymerase sigma factor [Pseudacidobacterium ailaaui]MCL6463440.1 RNA polymerase sigma factor [Pseudacidobacterium ailaaui]MDI3253620.1 RNA polymerase sigma factor [Bacillota bacterium]
MEQIAVTEMAPVTEEQALLELADFDEVVRLYRPRIFRFLLASLRDRDTAENLTQDCFLRAYMARDRFRGDCSLSTWLMKIATNLLRDHLRSRKMRFWTRTRESALDPMDVSDWLPDERSSPEESLTARAQVRAVWDAVDRLPAKQRSVFVLRFVEEMELKEIAEVTGMNQSTVKTHLYRALAAVRAKAGGMA